jgi:SWI/SNF-related matrix-associated actin-dependent regulator of chromatin subfamily A3
MIARSYDVTHCLMPLILCADFKSVYLFTCFIVTKKEEKVITVSFNKTEREEYNKLEATAKQIYLAMKSTDVSLISKNVLKLTSALMPMRVACSGGQVEEAESKKKSTKSEDTIDDDANGEVSDMECPICLDFMVNARATRCKPVAHMFCKVCIEGYFDGQHSVDCPSCRNKIKAKELTPVNAIKNLTSNAKATESPSTEAKKVKKKVIIDNLVFKTKFERLLVELKRIRDDEPDSKSLVFSQFSSTLQWMKQELPKHGFQFRTLSGDMPMTQRAKALREFQQDPPTTIFLLSMRSGAGMQQCHV